MNQTIVETAIMSVLAISLLSIVFLSIGRFSNFKFVAGQLGHFPNRTALELELGKRMTLIYSISSNAVYIGLLGTVLGVMITLSQIKEGSTSTGLIAALSLPLISTAASLVVAIIGTFIFNALNDEIERVKMLWDIQHGHSAQTRSTPTQPQSPVEEIQHNEESINGDEEVIDVREIQI